MTKKEGIKTNNKPFPFRLLSLLLSLALLLGAASLLSSCTLFPLTKEKLRDNIARDLPERVSEKGVAACLSRWGFPRFDTYRVNEIEQVFRIVYGFPDDLPDSETLARRAAGVYLDTYYGRVDAMAKSAVTDAMIRSLVTATGDAYARYRTAAEYEAFLEEMNGTYVGIGVTATDRAPEGVYLKEVAKDSAAEKAGLAVGDVIVAVDGVSYAQAGFEGLIELIRSKTDAPMTVTVKREEKTLDFTVTSGVEIDETVTCSVDGAIGTVTVTRFKANTGEQFVAAVDALEKAGVGAMIFDMRSNPGGYLSAVLQAISYLVPTGTAIVTYLGTTESSDDPHVLGVPCAVLCNGSTASAAELFTAALRDYNDSELLDATVVGSTTYGKGILQNSYTLSDGANLTLTVGTYDPPSGVNYHGVGIVPDVPVADGGDPLAVAKQLLNEKLK